MRRRIRLTGRKQISRSDVPAQIIDIAGKRILTLTFPEEGVFSRFPKDSRVVGVLKENKMIELVEFGTLGNMRHSVDLQNAGFARPTFQLRLVTPEGRRMGLLLGSTDAWSLDADSKTNERSKKGILYFQPDGIAPRAWKLQIQDDDYPIVYIDKRIPDASTWAKTDPTFVGFVFPAIVRQVFLDILSQRAEPDIDWMKDWVSWADKIMPGYKPPYGGDYKDYDSWIDRLIESFSYRFRLSDKLVAILAPQGDRP